MNIGSIVILGGILLLLLALAAWTDIRSRTIPNGVNAAIALLAPLWWWAHALPFWPAVALQIGIALIVFAIFAGAFALGVMGGGDVKMIGALALWLAPGRLLEMLMLMAILGGIVTVWMILLHRLRRADGRPEIPYGVAIAAAGFWSVANGILTNFAQ